MSARGFAHDESTAIHLCRKLLDLVEHEAPDAFPSQIARHNYIVDLNCVGREMNFDDSDELADELADETPWRTGDLACPDTQDLFSILSSQEPSDRLGIRRFDRPDEEFLASH
jgi:hypothetical protein